MFTFNPPSNLFPSDVKFSEYASALIVINLNRNFHKTTTLLHYKDII